MTKTNSHNNREETLSNQKPNKNRLDQNQSLLNRKNFSSAVININDAERESLSTVDYPGYNSFHYALFLNGPEDTPRAWQWRLDQSYIPDNIRERLIRDRKEASTREELKSIREFDGCSKSSREFSDGVYEDVTWTSRTTGVPFKPSVQVVKTHLVAQQRVAKTKCTLSYLINNKEKYGIISTKATISSIWHDNPNMSFSDKIIRLREFDKHNITKSAAYLCAAEARGSTSKVVIKLRSALSKSNEGVKAMETQGKLIQQNSSLPPNVGMVKMLTDMWASCLKTMLDFGGIPHTQGSLPMQDVFPLLTIIFCKCNKARILAVANFVTSQSWQTLTSTIPPNLVSDMVNRLYLYCSVLFTDDEQQSADWSMFDRKTILSMVNLEEEEEEGTLEEQSSFSQIATRIRDSPLVVRTLILLSKIFGMGLFAGDEEASGYFANTTANWCLKHVTKSMDEVLAIVNLGEYWMGRLKLFSSTLDPMDLFELDPDTMALKELEKQYALLTKLTNADGDVREQLLTASSCAMKHSKNANRLVSNMTQKLSELVMTLNRSLKVTRLEPLGLIVTGDPGTLKTSFVDALGYHWARIHKFPPDVSIVQYHQATKHQQLQTVVKILAVNDAFQVMDSEQPIPTLQFFQSLVDTAPYRAETASIEEKNMSGIAPDFVIATTNAPSFHCSTASGPVDKLDRRYTIVEALFTPKVMELEKSRRVDYCKQCQYRDCIMWRVGRMETSLEKGNKTLNFSIVLPPIGETEIKTFTKMSDLILFVEVMLGRVRKAGAPSSTFCTHCYMPAPSGVCSACGSVEVLLAQGGSMSVVHKMDAAMVEVVDTRLLAANNYLKENNDTLRTTLMRFSGKIKALAVATTAIMAVVGSIALLWKLAQTFFVDQGASVSTPDIPKEEVHVQKYNNKNIAWLNSLAPNFVVRIQNDKSFQHAVFVTQSLMMTNTHFFKNMPEGHRFVVTSKGETYEALNQPNLRVDTSDDVSFFYFPHARNITGWADARLTQEHGTPVGKCVLGTYNELDVQYHVTGYIYSAPTQGGDCGYPLMDGTGRIFGIHRGRYSMSHKALAAPVDKKQLYAAIDELTKRGYYTASPDPSLPEALDVLIGQGHVGLHPQSDVGKYVSFGHGMAENSGMFPICHFKFPDKGSMSTRPSLMFDEFGGDCKPMGRPYIGHAKEIDGVWCSPALYRLRARANKNPLVDHAILRHCTDFLLKQIPPVEPLTPIDLYRSIAGDENNAFMNARDNSKAIGWTLKAQGVTKANAYLLREDGKWDVHPLLLKEVSRILEEVRSTAPLGMDVVQATPKDEAYPLAKILECRARLFYVGDHASNLVMRMYILPILAHLAKNPFETGINIAMNPGSFQWKALAKWLGPNNIFAADFKEFDLSHMILYNEYNYFMYRAALHVGYSEGDATIARRIISRGNSSIMMMEGNVYYTSSEWFSGRPDTILGNCIMGKLIMLYSAFSRNLVPDPKRFRTIHTGDDLLASWDLVLSPTDVQMTASSLGYTMTAEDKRPVITFKRLDQVDYLKRGFKVVDGQMMAPLNLDSIYKSLAYVTGISLKDEWSRNASAAQCAAREMFMHGREAHERIIARLLTFFPEENFPDYDSLMDDYLHNNFAPWLVVKQRIIKGLPDDTYLGDLSEQSAGEPGPCTRTIRSIDHSMFMRHVRSFGTSYVGLSGPVLTHSRDFSKNSSLTFTSNINPQNIIHELNGVEPVVSIGTVDAPEMSYFSSSNLAKPDAGKGVSLAEFFARPRKIGGGDLSAFSSINCFSLWQAQVPVANVLKGYYLLRGSPMIHIVSTGSSSVVGLTRVTFMPTFNDDGPYESIAMGHSPPGAGEYTYSSNVPHVDIDFSVVTDKVIRLPYAQKEPWLAIKTGNDYYITVVPINLPKDVSGGTPDVINYEIYVSYENVVLDTIIPQSGELPKGAWSNTVEYASEVASKLPFQWAYPFSKALKKGSEALRFFGYSRPYVEASNMVVTTMNSNMSLCSGQPSLLRTFGVDPSVYRYTNPDLFPFRTPGETTPMSVASRYTQVASNWNETNITAYPLVVSPDASIYDLTSTLYRTNCSYVSGLFEWWNGDMDVCIQIVSSPLIRWRIGVVVVAPYQALPLVFPSGADYLTHIIESAGSTISEFTVPYLHRESFIRYDPCELVSDEITRTRIVYFSLTFPTGPGVELVYPYVNVWTRGGPNLSLGVPTIDSMHDLLIEQSGEVDCRPKRTGGVGPSSVATFGEVIDDLVYLTRRRSHVMTLGPGATSTVCFPVQPCSPSESPYMATTVISSQWSLLTAVSSLFYACSGSYTYTLVPHFSNSFVIANDFRDPGATATVSPPGGLPTDTSMGAGVAVLFGMQEFRAVDRCPTPFKYASNGFSQLATAHAVECFECRTPSPLTAMPMAVWSGGGDDYTIGGYLGPPRLEYRA